MNDVQFRVSSHIKDIVGRELITDEFVAVFELVKNSFDANATMVRIIFENHDEADKARLIIIDNGKGMDYDELINKWLFLAYSAKKDGTELDDYRDKITINRIFAGAKGIGRFSCDRLGAKLNLITKKDVKNSKIENLQVDWKDFERDPKEEFIHIPVKHQQLSSMEYDIKNGTILEVSSLRDTWNRDRILKLKKSLAKLINPNQGNDSENFEIHIIAEHERDTDKTKSEDRDVVNGIVKNNLFEMLEIKTTNIAVEISQDGEFITSTLQDRGSLIYKIKEKNTFSSNLSNIRIYLFQLNRSAKANFARLMGIPSVQYGSIFMYKNGFRVYPFGEEGEDLLRIDRRKAQGFNRFLGTRDLIGRIEINGENPELRETTSRDGGLVETATYRDLVEFFTVYGLRRLEKYAVEIIDWGDPKVDQQTHAVIRDSLSPQDVKVQILDVITSLANSSDVIDIKYDESFLNIIESKQDKSVNRILRNVSKIAQNSDDPDLLKEIKKIDKAVQAVKEDADKAIQKANIAEAESEKLANKLVTKNEELESQIKETLFVRAAIGTDTKELLSLQHHISRNSKLISRFLTQLIDAIKDKQPEKVILDLISKIDMKNKEVSTLSQFVTKANFNTTTNKINQDIISFVNEYLENVYKVYEYRKINGTNLNIEIQNIPRESFVKSFRPIELIIIIDNFISNSERANATKIVFRWDYLNSETLNLHIIDNGNGINDAIVKKIFDFRFTTTSGAGLGLYHIYDLVKKLSGEIQVNNKVSQGVEFIITFKR